MKYIKNLSPLDCEWLQLVEESPLSSPHVRCRSQSIRLSFQGHSIYQLSEIYKVHRDTVGIWLKQWNVERFDGLQDKPKEGCPLWLQESEHPQILHGIQESP